MCLVDPASGRLTLTEVDFDVKGAMPLVFERSYRSSNIWQSDLGQGWGHSFGVQLWRDEASGGLIFRATDGRRIPVPFPDDGAIALNRYERVSIAHVRQQDVPWPSLHARAEGIFAVSMQGSPTFLFDARHRSRFHLRGLADRSGNVAVIETGAHGFPERLQDPHGRILEFVRDRNGLLGMVRLRRDAAHAPLVLIEYRQDAEGNLIGARDAAGVRRYAYDHAHRLVSHHDRLDKECLSEFDAAGRCVLTQGPGGVKRRTYRYEPDALRTTITDSEGNATVIEYDDRERVVRTIDREHGVSTFTYDGEGRLVQATDQLGRTSSVLFDAVGAPAGKVRADGSCVGVVAGDTGEVTTMINSAGAVIAYERDALGRVVAVSAAGRGRTEVGYDAAGNIDRVKTPFGKEVRLAWSPDRRRLIESDSEGVLTEQELDEVGRVVSVRDALGAIRQYEYDASGEIARIRHPDGTNLGFARDAEGRLVAVTDEAGATTRWIYDMAGRCVEVVLPNGGRVRSDYDLESRLVAVVDPGGRRHEFRYTSEGYVAEASFPDGRTLAFKQDAVGRIVGMVHPDGSTTEASRDERGRIAATSYPDGSVKTAAHDPENHWIRVELAGHEIGRTVTSEGQAVEEFQDDFRLVREFGEAGELLAITDNHGRRVGYRYDENGRVVEVEVAEGRWFDDVWEPVGTPRAHRFEYDRVGNIRRWTLPSGIVETRSYDARRRLVEQTVAAEDRVVIRRRYGYNPLGRVVELDDSRRGRQRFSLDAMGRLTEAAGDRGVRRFSWGKSGERTGDLRYAAPFRASEDGGHAYHYDERGYVVRRVSATRTQELSWTPRGLLSEAFLSDGRTVQFAYDPHDRLIGRTVGEEARRYVWDNESLWGIRGNGGPRIGFVWVPGMRAPIEQSIDGRVFSIHADHIGTVRELVDEHGGIAWLNPAGLWGERSESDEISPVDCPLGFPGQIRDEITGLYYNRHRFYDGEIGRYLTPDPVGIFGGLDPYAYAPDPVNFYDPTGLACRGKNDDPTLLRGDSRPPDQICNQGFQPSNPAANISVLTHVNGVPTTGSNWISTTYESSTAERFANSAAAQYGGSPLVYVIDNPGCGVEVDCDPDVLAWEAQYGPAGSEQEIAFNGGVPASRILGYYPAGDPSAFQACP